MTDSAVSYVVTIYNKALFLPAVLNSIAAERAETGGEIILVDDGSTDGSPGILADFAKAHSGALVANLEVSDKTGSIFPLPNGRETGLRDEILVQNIKIITQKNQGVAAATNIGIAAATCPYLRLVDADDVLVSGSTRRLMAALQASGGGFAFGQFTTETHPEPISEGKVTILTDPLRVMLTRQPFIPATTLGLTATMKRALPLPVQFATAQDFSLGLTLARLTPFARIDDVCCISPAASGGLSASKARMFRDTALVALELGQQQGWAGRYRRLAIARNAGRARNYLRRHVKGRAGAKAAVSLLAIFARIPVLWPYKPLMTYIANAYSPPQ